MLRKMCEAKRLNAYTDYMRPVRYLRSARVYLLLLFMGQIRDKGVAKAADTNGAKCSGESLRNGGRRVAMWGQLQTPLFRKLHQKFSG